MRPTTRLWLVILATYAVSLVLDVALDAKYLGLYPAYGLAGCIAIIVVSKWLGKRWLQRPDPSLVPDRSLAERSGEGAGRDA